jgi:general secretion pathway protein C
MLVRLLDRHRRLLYIAAFAVCTLFGVRAMADMFDAIGDADAADPAPVVTPRPAPGRARAAAPSKSGAALAERNMFCSACQPAAPAGAAPIVADDGTPPATSLPLRLIATLVAAPASGRSAATVLHDPSGSQGAYGLGDRLPGAGAIVRIGGRSVDFENPAASRVERLALDEKVAAPAAPDRAGSADEQARPDGQKPDRRAGDPELQAKLDTGVRALDETTFEVDRKLVEDVLARPQAAARGARIVPRADGLRVFGVRPDSAHARLGLRSGDIIHSVNGIDLSSPDKMLEAITQLRNESSIALSITRRSEPVTLNYRVR